ncbi:MAG TPA: hypothetical protein VGC19_13830 [Rhodanobacter sp.]
MDEPLTTFILQLRLTQPELSSLLMAQITQARHSRLTLGRDHPVTDVDRATLEKLVSAQRQALADAGKAG